MDAGLSGHRNSVTFFGQRQGVLLKGRCKMTMMLPLLFALAAALPVFAQKPDPYRYPIRVPRVERPPSIDGDLSDWKRNAFSDGLWDINRLAHSPWYDPKINRITDHGNEPAPEEDLA